MTDRNATNDDRCNVCGRSGAIGAWASSVRLCACGRPAMLKADVPPNATEATEEEYGPIGNCSYQYADNYTICIRHGGRKAYRSGTCDKYEAALSKDHQSVEPSQEATLQDRLREEWDAYKDCDSSQWAAICKEAAIALDAKDARIADLDKQRAHWLQEYSDEARANEEQQREIERLTAIEGRAKEWSEKLMFDSSDRPLMIHYILEGDNA